MRQNFNSFKIAEKLARTWEIEPKLMQKRTKCVKKFYDELAIDTSFKDPLYKFEVGTYYRALDIMIIQLQERFLSINELNKLFSFLYPQSLLSLSDDELSTAASKLHKKYSADIECCISEEIVSFKNI